MLANREEVGPRARDNRAAEARTVVNTLKCTGKTSSPSMESFCSKFRKAFNDLNEYGQGTHYKTAVKEFTNAILEPEMAAVKAVMTSMKSNSIEECITDMLEQYNGVRTGQRYLAALAGRGAGQGGGGRGGGRGGRGRGGKGGKGKSTYLPKAEWDALTEDQQAARKADFKASKAKRAKEQEDIRVAKAAKVKETSEEVAPYTATTDTATTGTDATDTPKAAKNVTFATKPTDKLHAGDLFG